MNPIRLLPLACLLAAGTAQAQSAGECPLLPAGSNLTWQRLDGPDFTFCKAIRGSDNAEIFAVTLSEESAFEPRRSNRGDKTVIDGHEVRWYHGEIALQPSIQVRETLIELDDDHVAHISIRAESEDELAFAQRQVQNLRFQPATQFSSN